MPGSVNIVCLVDGYPVTFPADMVIAHASNLAMRVLDKPGGLALARESEDVLRVTSAIVQLCDPGERPTLVAAAERPSDPS